MKLLICDDDILTVDVIQSQLNYSELGITQILRAYNGAVAKEIIARERPELVLCDIGMPICDGLQVLKFVHEQKIETEFSLLTCHEDFAYAKTALQYGAANYLNKPVDFDELKIALQSMVASAAKKRDKRHSTQQARNDSVLNNVLRQISDGLYGNSKDAINSVLKRNGLEMTADETWHLVLTKTDMTDAVKEIWSKELLMYTIGRLCDETLVGYIGSPYSLINSDDRYIWCSCFVPERECGVEELRARCQRLMGLFTGQLSLRPVVLLSPAFALTEASEVECRLFAIARKFSLQPGKIYTTEEAEAVRGDAPALLDESQVLWYLKRHDVSSFSDYVSARIARLAESPNFTREAMDNLRCELIHLFLSSLRDNNIPSSVIFEDKTISELNLKASRSAENIRQFAIRLFAVTDERLQNMADEDDVIARVESYIRAHFRENITRDDVAAVAFITPNYLSKQFRNKMGMNMREYINQIRIEEAKRMLLTTNLSVSEVAGLVGYDNISYFSTVFRKHTGMTPVDWRSTGSESGANQ